MTSGRLIEYYAFVKAKPCLACGRLPEPGKPNHADHLKPWSEKLGGFGARSHKGLAAWYCVPLCPECHHKRHTMREEAFYEAAGWPQGKLYAYLTHQVLTFILENAGEEG